jgi:hypothetical protein
VKNENDAAGRARTWRARRTDRTGTARRTGAFIAGLALATTGLLPGVAVAAETSDPAPTLTVSRTVGLDPSGETVTLTGVGYKPTQAIYVAYCPDVPLADFGFEWVMKNCMGGAIQVKPDATTGTPGTIQADGTFTAELPVAKKADWDFTAIYTLNNHTAMTDRSQDVKVPVAFRADAPSITVSKAAGLDPAGEKVTVTGAGYRPDQAIYVAHCPDVSLSEVSFAWVGEQCRTSSIQVKPDTVTGTPGTIQADGTFTAELTVTKNADWDSSAIYTVNNHTAMADRSQDVKVPVSFAVPTAKPTLTVSRTTGLDPAGETVTVTGAGYKSGQAVYVTHCPDVPLADVDFGWVGATCVDGAARAKPDDTGAFNVELKVVKNAEWDASAIYTVNDHTAMGDRSQDVKVAISFAGTQQPQPVKGTVSSAIVVAGGQQTVSGGGFTADETVSAALVGGSTTLPMATAGADGKVRYTFTVPAEPGDYRLELTGSASGHVVYGEFEVVATTDEPTGEVVVTDGYADWGFKDSFRTYIEGAAGGRVDTSGGVVAADGRPFRFPNAVGVVDLDAGTAELGFDGGVRFVGHNGLLDVSVANPRVEIAGDKGTLFVDVSSVPLEGGMGTAATVIPEPKVWKDLAFATLDLSGIDAVTRDKIISWSDIPVTLSAAGAEAFAGFYNAGDELDPLSITVAYDDAELPADPADGDDAGAVTDDDTRVEGVRVSGGTLPRTGGSGLGLLGLGAGLVVAGAGALVATRRRTASGLV